MSGYPGADPIPHCSCQRCSTARSAEAVALPKIPNTNVVDVALKELNACHLYCNQAGIKTEWMNEKLSVSQRVHLLSEAYMTACDALRHRG